ncbi:MAG TPA: C4-dicarboxylate transporter DctA [Stellaceae bacterium]
MSHTEAAAPQPGGVRERRGGGGRRWYANLTVQVLAAIAIGILLGHFRPSLAVEMKPFGDAFVRLIRMAIGPIVFLTVVTGISHAGDMRKVGRVGLKALIYFEIVTTLCLFIGLAVVNLLKPGAGLALDTIPKGGGGDAAATAVKQANAAGSTVDMLLGLIPDNFIKAFANGDLLQILVFSVLFGAALSGFGEKGRPVEEFLERVSGILFGVIGIVMRVAPLGAFGAMAFTIGKYGVATLLLLGKLMAGVYITMALFVVLVLGAIARSYGFSLWRFLKYIREELLLVLGTSTTETVLPRMMEKLQKIGCSKAVVGLVLPTGYSFNQDGTSIYLSMSAIFIAQVYGIELSLAQQIGLIAVMMVTSKGAAGVTGSGFVILAATVSATGVVPVEGLALLLGVERFMSEARAITNVIGNGVATIVVAKMEREFDEALAVEEYKAHFGEPELARI